jgi:hypothetical protein
MALTAEGVPARLEARNNSRVVGKPEVRAEQRVVQEG